MTPAERLGKAVKAADKESDDSIRAIPENERLRDKDAGPPEKGKVGGNRLGQRDLPNSNESFEPA